MAQHRSRPFQFSLRSLMLVTLFASCACSFVAVQLRKAEEQRSAVNALGGRVYYDDQPTSSGWYFDYQYRDTMLVFGDMSPPHTSWLGNRFGRDYFCTVVAAWAEDDGQMKELGRLPKLRELDLWESAVTDEGLSHLEETTGLQGLAIKSREISDKGLSALRGLTRLRRLHLRLVPIDDLGLRNLAGLSRLETLDLHGTKITGVGLREIRGLSKLRELDLSETATTDAGMDFVSALKELQTLDVASTRITDASAMHLATLTRLRHLNLAGTRIGDATLDHFSGLRELKSLWVAATKVTPGAVKRLRRALPSCRIGGLPEEEEELKYGAYPRANY